MERHRILLLKVQARARGAWRSGFINSYRASKLMKESQTVLTFLILLTSALHYVIQILNFKRDVLRIEEIRTQARAMAWGSKMIPTSEGKRKASSVSNDFR